MIAATGTVLLMLVLAGVGWAAAKSSVSIRGPKQAQAGARVQLRFTGYAASGVPRLRVWLDDRSCATTAQTEAGRAGLRHRSFAVSGRFRDLLTVEHSAAGTHVVCAYLVYGSSGGTAARASWRYVTG